jgi:hypothetical protein
MFTYNLFFLNFEKNEYVIYVNEHENVEIFSKRNVYVRLKHCQCIYEIE